MLKYILGIDIGGTKIQTGLVNTNLKVIQGKQSVMKRNTKSQALNSIFNSIEDYNPKDIKAIGISITGLVDSKKGIAIKSPNLPKGFFNVPLTKLISKKFKKPTFIENDGNCIALAEAIVGEGKNNKIVFSLTLGTGIGSGLIINKKLYTGSKNIFEFGHTFISNEKQKCNCGQYGHFESFVTGDGIQRTYKKLTNKNKTSYEIIKEAKLNKSSAKKAVVLTSHYLTLGLANIINSYNPDIIVLGGGLAKLNVLTKPAIKNIYSHLSSPEYKKTKVKVSKLGYDAGVLGAALLTRYTRKK
ncbi:MAG: ROK family protein [Candidatus Kerfeldbacteria bacterium]|jgi:glucokinase